MQIFGNSLHCWMWRSALQWAVDSDLECVHHILLAIYCLQLNWHTFQWHSNSKAAAHSHIWHRDKRLLFCSSRNPSNKSHSPMWAIPLFWYFDSSSPKKRERKSEAVEIKHSGESEDWKRWVALKRKATNHSAQRIFRYKILIHTSMCSIAQAWTLFP